MLGNLLNNLSALKSLDERYLNTLFCTQRWQEETYEPSDSTMICIFEDSKIALAFSLFSRMDFTGKKTARHAVIPVFKSSLNRAPVWIHPNIVKVKMSDSNKLLSVGIEHMIVRKVELNGYAYYDLEDDVHIFAFGKILKLEYDLVLSTDIIMEQYDKNIKYWDYANNIFDQLFH